MSQVDDDAQKNGESSKQSSETTAEKESKEVAQENSESKPEEKKTESKKPVPPAPQVGRPVIGRPIGTPVGTPIGKPSSTAPTTPASAAPATPPAAKPASQVAARPAVGTPVASRPTIGSPVGTRPSVGSPTAPRPATTGPPVAGRPTIPTKPVASKRDASRRNFLKLLAVAGGLVAILQFGALGPYLQGSVKVSEATTQKILDVSTGQTIKTTDPDFNTKGFKIFIYPRTGNSNVDNDTFSQCVVIKLPQNLTAPSNLSVRDPISGSTFIAFSRVCLHLWCLWNYNLADLRMECPCHGSQYVPGTGPYPSFPQASNQPPGLAVAGPASLQTPPNNQLPVILLSAAGDGTLSATGIVGQVGCGQLC